MSLIVSASSAFCLCLLCPFTWPFGCALPLDSPSTKTGRRALFRKVVCKVLPQVPPQKCVCKVPPQNVTPKCHPPKCHSKVYRDKVYTQGLSGFCCWVCTAAECHDTAEMADSTSLRCCLAIWVLLLLLLACCGAWKAVCTCASFLCPEGIRSQQGLEKQ